LLTSVCHFCTWIQVTFSKLLNIDVDRQRQWQRMADLLAPLPITTDSISGKKVLASQDNMPSSAFPAPKTPGNARYPIVFYMVGAMAMTVLAAAAAAAAAFMVVRTLQAHY
jgi:hypothetical protein